MAIAFGLTLVLVVAATLYRFQGLSLASGCLVCIMAGIVLGHPYWHQRIEPLPLPWTLDRLIWAGLIVSLAGLAWRRRVAWRQPGRTDLLVILWGLVLVASTALHDWRFQDNQPVSRLVFFNLMPIGFYFVGKHCRLEQRLLLVLYGLLTAFGLYLGLVGIAEQRGWSMLVWPGFILAPENEEFLGRARGPLLNPVAMGIYLVICLAATAGLWRSGNRFFRGGLLVIAGCILLCSFLTLTRSVWLSMAVAIGWICWLPATPRVRGGLVVAGTVGIVAGLLLFSDKVHKFQRDKHVSAAAMAESATLRPMLTLVAWKMFCDKPIAGHGFGQYTAAKPLYHYSETADMPLQKVLPYVQHNVFLSCMAETGLIGLVPLLALLVSALLNSRRLWLSGELPWAERWFGVIVLCGVSAWIINGMFHDVSIIPHIGGMLFLLLGFQENLKVRPRQPAPLVTTPSGDSARQVA